MMAQELEQVRVPLTLFGGFREREGRLDLKLNGLFPLVAGARAMALRHGVAETSTAARLEGLAAAGLLGEADLAGLLEARRLFMTLILEQQLVDLRAGGTPGTRVEVARLASSVRSRLRRALRQVGAIHRTVLDVVGAADRVPTAAPSP
jgi:DNA polymerase-3 subunit epsilon/CBS domain-containing protein